MTTTTEDMGDGFTMERTEKDGFVMFTVHPPATTPDLPDDVRKRAAELAREMFGMIDRDPHRGTEDAAAFLGPATKDRTRAIGAELDTLGGLDLMYAVHQVVSRYDNRYSRVLDYAWDGIGDWRG